MLKFRAYDFENKEILLPDFLEFELQKEENVPADYLEVKFKSFKNAENINYIRLFNNDTIVFLGICDEILFSKDLSGAVVTLYFRNKMALLIDNEALPHEFNNVTARVLFNKYIKQLGFKNFIANDKALTGKFIVEKGESIYDALYNFTMLNYSSEPYLADEDTISFINNNKNYLYTLFSDGKNADYQYRKIECSKFPYKLISKINVKTSASDYYKTAVKNNFALEKGIIRERYLDACNLVTSMSSAQKMINNSNNEFEEYRLYFNSLIFNSVYEKCSISDYYLGNIENLYISKIIVGSDMNGYYSKITLKKEERYVVA